MLKKLVQKNGSQPDTLENRDNIINHLNLLMKAFDKNVMIEGASLDYTQTGVYMVENEIIPTTAYKSRANFIADEASLLSSSRQAPKRRAAYCMFYLLAFFHDYVFGKTRTCF